MPRATSATGRRANPGTATGGDSAPGAARSRGPAKAGRDIEIEQLADPRAALRIELRQWSLKRGFVHQFALLARPKPSPVKPVGRRSRRNGEGGSAIQRYHRGQALKARSKMAAQARQVKTAGRGAGVRQGAALPEMAVRAGWPDQMKRDLAACRSPRDRLLWAFKWAETLAGRVLAVEQPQRPRPPPLSALRPLGRLSG